MFNCKKIHFFSKNRALHTRRNRGVTLVEVMIVVVILGLISAGAAVAIFPQLKKGQIKTTQTSALEIRRAAVQWLGDHPGECPTPERLIRDKVLDSASKITDAWDTPFKIVCSEDEEEEGEIYVISFGPDRKENTKDDIRVPDLPASDE